MKTNWRCKMNNILRELRIKNGYTQDEIAKKLGYKNRSGYNHLENGNVKLSITHAIKLSKIYGVSVDFFLNNVVKLYQTQ